jgi:TonB-dependent receptor
VANTKLAQQRARSQRQGFLSALLRGVSAAALASMAFIAPAHAQDAEEEIEDDGVIVVTGLRNSVRSAQEIKRDSDVIVDSITAVDIGALPDRSVSEALQRVPGITLQRTNENRDPARLASEGGAVFVRGLSWVRSEINGRDAFSANNGRNLSFEDVSADLLAGVDVFKSPSAELIEGGIGGIVNLRTRVPFDQDGRLIAGSIDYNYADLLEEGFTSGNVLLSDRWDTPIGEFGALVSVSVAEVGNRTDSIQTGRFEARTLGAPQDGLAAGDTVYIPTSIGFRSIDWRQSRDSYAVALQWSPTNDLTFTLQGLYATANPVDVERAMDLGGAGGSNIPTDDTSYVFDDNNAIVAGTYDDASITADTRYGNREFSTGDFSLNMRYTPNGPWSFSADVQYVESDAEVLSMTAFTQLGLNPANVAGRPEVTFDFTGDTPFLSISDSTLQAQQNQYWWAAAMDHIEDNDARAWAERVDVEYAFPDDGFLRSFRFGVRASQRDAVTRQSGWNWSLLSNQFWGSDGRPVVYLDQNLVPGQSQQTELHTFPNFFRGDVAVPGVGWFPVESLLTDTQYAYSFLQSTESGSWGWAPLVAPGAFNLNPQADNVSAGINRQSEDTTAYYAVLRFGEERSPAFDGNIGLRVVETEVTGTGRSTAGYDGATACGMLPSPDCAAAQAFVNAFNAELGGYHQRSHSYTNVLPSLNLRFHLSDEVQLRLAASQSMVRPSFSQTRAYENLSISFTGNQFNIDPALRFTGMAGAPDLKPTTSFNLDASLEWFFADAGSLAVAVFRKEIEDYIVLQRNAETYTYGGQTFTFDVQRQVNAEEGQLTGFEIQYSQFYDFLPGPLAGLGLQANFTYIDNEGGANTAINPFEPAQVAGVGIPLPIEGMSRTSYNVTAMYEMYGISARLAYNWRERYLLTTSAANINRPVWSEDYGQLDGSIFYTINDHVKIGLQGTNLLNSRTFLDVGDTTLAPRYSWTDTDRRFAFAIRAQF